MFNLFAAATIASSTCADIVWPYTDAPPAVVDRVGNRRNSTRRQIQSRVLKTIDMYNSGRLGSYGAMATYLAGQLPVSAKRQDQFRREFLAKIPSIMASPACNKRAAKSTSAPFPVVNRQDSPNPYRKQDD